MSESTESLPPLFGGPRRPLLAPANVPRDLTSGLVVFLVALPLCLGIAVASGTPPISGLIAGIVGGLVVGSISGSHTSVSGPAAGLVAIVLAQIAALESFEAFLFATFLAGIMQIGLGIARAGALSAFFPSSVIRGLLAAIGVILILKQIPHLVGHDNDPEGEMSFNQPDEHNTFSEIGELFSGDFHTGAAVVGFICITFLIGWNSSKVLKKTGIPGPLAVVILGVVLQWLFRGWGDAWRVGADHLVKIPIAETTTDLVKFFTFPDFTVWNNPQLYLAAVTIALVASLETLLNLEAVDKLDPENRNSPPSRELVAQGAGNMVSGLIGGLPVTSVIIRSSVNVNTGVKTKLSALFHGFLLVVMVGVFPQLLNTIPLASLAAILIVTGFKLASPQLFMRMWNEGRYQFIPFIITLVAIVFSDLLIGILIGLAVSALFILNSNLRRPIRRIVETHLDGDITHVELANQVSFLNRAALDKLFTEAKSGSHMLLDASATDYIDPDVLSMIRDFKDKGGPARDVKVSLRGFRSKYQLQDEMRFADYTTRELQDKVTPAQVLEILREGNRRFRSGERLTRDLGRQVGATASGQNPFAVVLGCIDSRVPAEIVFDLGIGDIFAVRVAGNVIGTKTLGSLEYAVAIAGVKLVLVLGHTKCGAITSAVQLLGDATDIESETGCQHLHTIVDEISDCIDIETCKQAQALGDTDREDLVDDIVRKNVSHTVDRILASSAAVREARDSGNVMVIGAVYDVRTGEIEFFEPEA